MAKVSYKPADGEPTDTEQFGYVFEGKKPVEVTDAKHLMKFEGNPDFVVEHDKK